jgi:hypothetical protein
MGRADLAGAAHLELVSGVVQLRPEDAMLEAMLRGWRAQQTARGTAITAAAQRGSPQTSPLFEEAGLSAASDG